MHTYANASRGAYSAFRAGGRKGETMQVTWFGHASFKLTDALGFSVITDPYTPEGVGYAPITETADCVLISSDDDDAHCRADLIPGTPPTLNALDVALDHGGEAEVAGLKVKAIEAAEWVNHPRGVPGQNGMYRFEMDGLQVAHMGDVGNPLTDDQMAFFEDVLGHATVDCDRDGAVDRRALVRDGGVEDRGRLYPDFLFVGELWAGHNAV